MDRRCECGDCMTCDLAVMAERTEQRRQAARAAARWALRAAHRRALAAGATPEQLDSGRAA